MGGQFWSAYIGCDSSHPVKEFLEQIDVIKQIVQKYPETFQWADSVAGVRASFRAGKIASLVGVESGHAINSSLAVLRSLYSLGKEPFYSHRQNKNFLGPVQKGTRGSH